ncbi:MAG TPA: hypothetical protein PKK12_08435, partial [Candidatus Aminicenantes bacterium]|nr:hypothetical protein [Candidatus Aminicenantes bacterium]
LAPLVVQETTVFCPAETVAGVAVRLIVAAPHADDNENNENAMTRIVLQPMIYPLPQSRYKK